MKEKIGIIGLSVMGSNLALNLADHNYDVAIFNRTTTVVDEVMEKHPHQNLHPTYSLEEFVNYLSKPRRVMLMVKAGVAVDAVIKQLIPLLDKGDIIIDGGNSYFKDTQRRYDELCALGLNFYGVGVSGGEEGARFGPALMPGGNRESYTFIQPILEDIAAKVNGVPCCNYTSTGGAGHYVKMVHNGIEYGDMQLISEAYTLLKHIGGFSNEELAELFKKWDQEELESYLIHITSNIFKVKDGNNYLVDVILDESAQKGTGKWTNLEAIDLGVDISVITSALNGRFMSTLKQERLKASTEFNRQAFSVIDPSEKEAFALKVKYSLYVAKILSYAQGFKLLQEAAKAYNWEFNYADIARIFRGGCIIQARLLQNIIEAYEQNPKLENLIFDDFFKSVILQHQQDLRDIAICAITNKLPIPSMQSALQYLDVYTTANSGANLIQAQRDYFGAHTFKRIDEEGIFHYDWVNNAKL